MGDVLTGAKETMVGEVAVTRDSNDAQCGKQAEGDLRSLWEVSYGITRMKQHTDRGIVVLKVSQRARKTAK